MTESRSPIEIELAAEHTHSLTRATRLLEEALQRLEVAGASLARDELLEEAQERLWNVLVQREAMGLFHHQVLFEVLLVPEAVRANPKPRSPRR